MSPVPHHQAAGSQVALHQVAGPQVAEHQVAVQEVQMTQFVDPYASGSFPAWDWTVLSDGLFSVLLEFRLSYVHLVTILIGNCQLLNKSYWDLMKN